MPPMNAARRCLFVAVLLALCAGCGQDGDLYLPDEERRERDK